MTKETFNLLESFDNSEIAYFVKYRLKSFMPNTQNEISSYLLHKRKLTVALCENIVLRAERQSVIVGEDRCPRCGSSKIISSQVECAYPEHSFGLSDEISAIDAAFTGKTPKTEKKECIVCSYQIMGPDAKVTKYDFPIFRSIWRRFKEFIHKL